MPISIRSRVLLLVLAVLVPALLGLAWVILNTYAAERRANERSLRDTARALSQRIDGELLRRSTIASVLAQSTWLDAPAAAGSTALNNFEQQARRALQGLDGWIELRDENGVLLDTRGKQFVASGAATQQQAAPWQTAQAEGARMQPLWMPPATQLPGNTGRAGAGEQAQASVAQASVAQASVAQAAVPHAAIVQPVKREGRLLYELVITILPLEMQRIVDALALSPGSVGAVLDNRAAVVARYPGATNFTGQLATPDLQQLLRTKDEGLFHSTSLDGRPTTGYFSRAPMGWTFVAGLPETRFAGSLRNTMKPIFIGALLLLGLAVAGSLALARRIVEPVRSLKTAVLQLQNQQPVEIRATGLVECDEVTVALAEAEETIRHARADLESQVAHAVQRTQLTEKRAAQSQRVAAVGRLTGGVAHDFNNLLGVVSNSAHLIQRHPAAAELAAPLAAMQRAVESGSQLTQHLLRFSGRRAVRPQRLRPREVLPEMQDMLRSVLGRHVTVSVQVAADTQTIRVDASELELALINLALNARDAMPRGGELRLGARNADSRDLSSSPELAPGDYVLISVGDDGIGMDAGVIAHAFEPFFTTKATGQGGGLGLSQVHGFCVQAGGTARVDSTPGLGTTVVLLLPGVEGQMGSEDDTAAPRAAQVVCESTSAASAASATSEVSAAAAVSAVSPTPAPASAPTAVDITGAGVLLVEDNQALADTTEALLVAHGAQVTRADDALQALRLIETGAAFDVVLSDVMMPGATDGLALARYLRDLRPALPVILITALGQAVAGEEGEFKVLHKPCPQPELLAAVFQAINESHSSRAAARLKP